MERTDLPDRGNGKLSPELLARNLKLLRKIKGVSQQQLANTLGLKRNIIASYESGIVEPTPERLLAIARIFKVEPLSFLTVDFSDHPTEKLSEEKSPVQDEWLAEEMDAFISQTMDLQKVIEGFKEFHKVKKQQQETKDDPTLNSLNNDFENLLEILKKLLDTNWDLIHSLQK